MCCEPIENGPTDGSCPECEEPVNMDGEAVYGCHYSPVACETCGWKPCDGSC